MASGRGRTGLRTEAKMNRHPPDTDWHAMTPAQAAAALETDSARGLAPAEAARRPAAYGPNRIARAPAWGLAGFSFFIALTYAVKPGIRYDLVANIRATGSEGSLFAFLGRVLRPDPADAFPSLIRAAPADLALGAAWLALVVVLVLGSRGRLASNGQA